MYLFRKSNDGCVIAEPATQRPVVSCSITSWQVAMSTGVCAGNGAGLQNLQEQIQLNTTCDCISMTTSDVLLCQCSIFGTPENPVLMIKLSGLVSHQKPRVLNN